MDQLLHLVREVAIVGAELQVEVDHGELGARLHAARDGQSSQEKADVKGRRRYLCLLFSGADESH